MRTAVVGARVRTFLRAERLVAVRDDGSRGWNADLVSTAGETSPELEVAVVVVEERLQSVDGAKFLIFATAHVVQV
jgi:hypothetical protein